MTTITIEAANKNMFIELPEFDGPKLRSTSTAAVFHHRYNANYTSVGKIAALSYCFPGEEPGSRDISRTY